MKQWLVRPESVFLYDEGTTPELFVGALAEYGRATFPGLRLEARGEFFQETFDVSRRSASLDNRSRLDGLAHTLAATRVTGPGPDSPEVEPMPAEISYEKRRLTEPSGKGAGILYDALALQAAYGSVLAQAARSAGKLHIVFTDRLFGSLDEGDARVHARAVVLGPVSLISTTGIVEAPARPREYYLLRNEMNRLGRGDLGLVEAKQAFEGDIIDYGDRRMTEVAKGYIMQAIIYMATGEPFCSDASCRLFNAHWQKELIAAQLGQGPEFCSYHTEVLEELAKTYRAGS